uniref:Uncharacterized protein n=1 Tax=Arundo donax TaxID=35708 RepID=A0A0A8YY42_ARUDO
MAQTCGGERTWRRWRSWAASFGLHA